MKADSLSLADALAEKILTPLKFFSGKPLSLVIAFTILSVSIGLWAFWLAPAARSFTKLYRDLTRSLKEINASNATKEEKLAKVDQLFENTKFSSNWIEYRACIEFTNDDVFSYSDPRNFFYPDRINGGGYTKWSATLGGVFLTTGLVFTFIGLSAALLNIDTSPEQIRRSIENILNVSSAKFITSIAGIICYIAWTITSRRQTSGQEHVAHMLCAELRQLFTYISPEILLKKQLCAVERQEDLFKGFSSDLAVAIGQQIESSLRARLDTLPTAIADKVGETLAATMLPVSKELSEIGQQIGMAGNQITGGAGDIFSKVWQEGIGSHLNQFGDQMSKVIAALDGLPEKVRSAESGMGSEIGKASKEFSDATLRVVSSIETAHNNFNNSLQSFGEKVANIPGVIELASEESAKSIREALSKAILESSNNIDKAAEQTAEQFSRKVNSIAGTLEISADKLKEASQESADYLKSANQDLEIGLRNGIKSINDAAHSSSSQLALSIAGLSSIVENLSATLGKTATQIDDHQTRLASAGNIFSGASEKLVLAATSVENTTKPLSAIVKDIQSSLEILSNTVKQLDKTTEATQKATTGLDQTIVKVHEIAASQAEEFSNLQTAVRETINDLIQGVGRLAAEISKCLDTYDNEIAKSIGSLETAILDVADIVDERKANGKN